MKTENRTWLVCAQNDKCNHANAIKKLGFINWAMGTNFHFAINDIVYIYMSEEKKVRYRMVVTNKNCKREDKDYWNEAPNDNTYKLQFVKEYKGDLLNEDKLIEHGFNGISSIQYPICNNSTLIKYIDEVFNQRAIHHLDKNLYKKPMLIVDLNSGSYLNYRKGHETFNLERNPIDGRFYEYCPPNDRINISRLGAHKTDEFISGVTVIYTTKLNSSSDREIIAFCEDATVHRRGHIDKRLKRIIDDNGEKTYCSYTIESDSIINLTTVEPKFKISISDYNTKMFRMQRVFKGSYPKLDIKILNYIQNYIKHQKTDDDFSYQEEIQNEEDYNLTNINDTLKDEPEYQLGDNSQSVKKNPRIAKLALANSEYKCAINADHQTFTTNKGVPYMEGHHLIPCTYTNAKHFWEKINRNIDCLNNIICLCPTCHRKIHYASDEEKKAIIKQLYKNQKDKLNKSGLNISLEELLELYDIK